VPEPLGDNLERLAGGQRRCCIAVPDAVQDHRRQAGVADQGGEPLGDVLGVEDLAVLAGKDRGGRGEVSPSGITSRTGQTHRTPEPWMLPRCYAVRGHLSAVCQQRSHTRPRVALRRPVL